MSTVPPGSTLVSVSHTVATAGVVEEVAAVLAALAALPEVEMAMNAETALDGAAPWSPSGVTTTCVNRKAVTMAAIQMGT